MTRSFTSLAAAVDEICDSRIYGGIHFRFATDAGKRCGDKVGEAVVAEWMRNQTETARSGR